MSEQDPSPFLSMAGSHDYAESSTSSPRSRRSTVRVACNACRAKKIRCDGQRPVCGWCAARPGTVCVYDTGSSDETRSAALRRENESLRTSLNQVNSLLQPLLTLPEEESIQLLKRLRLSRELDVSSVTGGTDSYWGGASIEQSPRFHDNLRNPEMDGVVSMGAGMSGSSSRQFLDHSRGPDVDGTVPIGAEVPVSASRSGTERRQQHQQQQHQQHQPQQPQQSQQPSHQHAHFNYG